MRNILRAVLITATLGLSTPLLAGPSEDAKAAYERGDYATALRLYRQLAEGGDGDAQCELGRMYLSGNGVPQDYIQSTAWFRKAAEQGNVKGLLFLGGSYYEGRGVAKDYVQAHKWFSLAASRPTSTATDENVRDVAADRRDELTAHMTVAQIAEAQKLAREWKPTK